MRRRALLVSLGATILAGCGQRSTDETPGNGGTADATTATTRPAADAETSVTEPPTPTPTETQTAAPSTTTPPPEPLEPPTTLDGGWPMSEFDPGATGYRPRGLGHSSSPARRWERSLVPATDHRTPISALLAGGGALFAGTYDRGFWRLDPATGQESGWREEASVPLAVGPELLYATNLDRGRLEAVPGPDTDPVWTTSMTPHRARLTASRLFASPRAGGLVAFDATSGAERWRVGAATVGRAGGLAVGPHHLLVRETDRLSCFDAHSGARLWHFAPDLGDGASLLGPVLADGTAYVGKAGNYVGEPTPRLWAFDVETGERRWTHENRYGLDPETVGPDLVAGAYRAIARADGSTAWENEFNPPEAGRRTIRLGDVVYHSTGSMGSGPGRLYAFDAASGTRRWVLRFPAGLDGLIAVGDWLVASDLNGTVHGIR